MEILLLLIVIVLAFIAYKLIGLEKAQAVFAATRVESLSTSFNPLFSEKDIAFQKSLSQEWQKKVEFYFHLLQRTEKEEIERHQSSGKDKSEFLPSSRLKSLILYQSVAITGRNTTEIKAERMIEANISILNGKSIREVSEKFDSEQDGIPWDNVNLDADVWSNRPEIRKAFEEDLLARSEFWQSSWKHILDKTYLDKG
jgi:flagellar basal body rod protein FlgB